MVAPLGSRLLQLRSPRIGYRAHSRPAQTANGLADFIGSSSLIRVGLGMRDKLGQPHGPLKVHPQATFGSPDPMTVSQAVSRVSK